MNREKRTYMSHAFGYEIYIHISFDRDRQRQTDAVAAAALRSSFPRTNLSFNLFVSAYMATTQYMWLIEMDGHYWKEMDAWNRKF